MKKKARPVCFLLLAELVQNRANRAAKAAFFLPELVLGSKK